VTGRGPPYRVNWAPEAWEEVHALAVFERRPIMRAADELAYHAEVETRNRKPLRRLLEELPAATWEVRIRSKYRPAVRHLSRRRARKRAEDRRDSPGYHQGDRNHRGRTQERAM